MKHKFIGSIIAMIFAVFAHAAPPESKDFGDWKVQIRVDDFEGDVEPTLTTEILSPQGQKIGDITISYFVLFKGVFNSAIMSLDIDGLDPSFPTCAYKYTKYKIDSAESKYFDTTGYACPHINFMKGTATMFSTGKSLRLSASSKTGIASLIGFKEAWVYALSELKK